MLKKTTYYLLITFLLILFTMIIMPTGDEIWEYGFGYNISTGLIPYKDFNMIVTPLYPLSIALFIKIFGSYLISAHIFNAVILTATIYLLYKMLDKKMLLLLLIILIHPNPGYNNLLMFLFVLLIYTKKTSLDEYKNNKYSAIICSLMLLTKQSVGLLMLILDLYFSKNKKKHLLYSSIPLLLLFIYLFTNNSLYNFIDYAFLGLFDFAEKNSHISIYMILTFIMCSHLLYSFIKTKNIETLYYLVYQSITIPIFDIYHFYLGFIIYIFWILQTKNIPLFKIKYYIQIPITIILISIVQYSDGKIEVNNSFFKYRNIPSETINLIENTSNYISNLNYNKLYIFSTSASYMIKMYNKIPIDKYDIILNGNMGYNGADKYIKEINNNCKEKKCIFIIQPYSDYKYDQVNHKIIDYITDNYKKIHESEYYEISNYFTIYTNQ